MIDETTESEPTLIISLDFGYTLIKIPCDEPMFQLRQGIGLSRDIIHIFNFSDAVKFLKQRGDCADYKEAIKLLSQGDCHE